MLARSQHFTSFATRQWCTQSITALSFLSLSMNTCARCAHFMKSTGYFNSCTRNIP
jgi:hypothetical protein